MGERCLLRCLNELGSGTTNDVSLIPLVMSIVLRMIRIGMSKVSIRIVSFLFLGFWGWLFLFFLHLFLFCFVFGGHFRVNKILPFFFTLCLFDSSSCSLLFFSVSLPLVCRVSAFFFWCGGGLQVVSSYLHGHCYHFYFLFPSRKRNIV